MNSQKEDLNFLDIVRDSEEKPHNTCTTQLVISIVFEISYCIGSSKQNSKTKMSTSSALHFHSVFDIKLISFFDELQHFFWQSLILDCLYLDRGKKKP